MSLHHHRYVVRTLIGTLKFGAPLGHQRHCFSPFSLIIGISLWLSMLLLVQAAPPPATGDLSEIVNKPNVVKSLVSLSPAMVSATTIDPTASSACDSYYLRRNIVNVGGSAGNQKIVNATLPTAVTPAVTNQLVKKSSQFTDIDSFIL